MFDEENKTLQDFRDKIISRGSLSTGELIEFTNKYEDLMTVANVSLKMLDHVVRRHQRTFDRFN